MTRKAVWLAVLLCLCFLTQPFQQVWAAEEDVIAAESPAPPEAPPEITTSSSDESLSSTEANEPVADPSPPTDESPPDEQPPPDEPTGAPEDESTLNETEDVEGLVGDEDMSTEGDTNALFGSAENETADNESSLGEAQSERGVASESASSTESSVVEESTGAASESEGTDSSTNNISDEASATSTENSTNNSSAGSSGGAASSSSQHNDSEATSTEEVLPDSATSSATSTEEAASDDNTETASDNEAAEENSEGVQEESSSETATTSEEVESEPDTSFVSVVQSDSHFSFNRNECTRIEDGSFYCQKLDEASLLEDDLIAAPDADGDLEIYLVRHGERTQITRNTVDDASPYYDEVSKTIVWHRLLNDRYQIISFDIETGEEEQLTNTAVNDMEPTRSGDYVVWQRWVNNNWEIILYDGNVEKQITDSARHDIAPHIRGPLVIWNSRSNDGTQQLMTYDIQDRVYTTIGDGEGVSVANPRMVVMYEAMYENGDIITKGFDLVSGEIIPLHSLPKQLPEEIPNTDSTGETRALIQSKPVVKQVDITPDDDTESDTLASTTHEVVDAGSLDLRASSTDDTLAERAFAVLDDSLDLRPTSTPTKLESTNKQPDIPDIVIQDFNEPEQIASSTQQTEE